MSAGGDRLDRTRLAILEHVHRKELRRQGVPPEQVDAVIEAGEYPPPVRATARPRQPGPGGWATHARDLVDDWWRYHPAHMAVDLVRPSLAAYARRRPVRYLGFAAAAGVALFLLRPWKLISATGVLVALVKSPQVASLVMSAMATSHNPRDDEAVEE